MSLTKSLNCEGIIVEEESAFHFLCVYATNFSFRTRIIGKPILLPILLPIGLLHHAVDLGRIFDFA
jgi:hypothetical protein